MQNFPRKWEKIIKNDERVDDIMVMKISQKNYPMVCDSYVKYEQADYDRLALMEDFWDNEKNGRQSVILDFISAKFVMSYPCVRPYILLYNHGLAIFGIVFELRKYHKITQIQNVSWTDI